MLFWSWKKYNQLATQLFWRQQLSCNRNIWEGKGSSVPKSNGLYFSNVLSFALSINNVNFHTHHSAYQLMENENCLAHLLETAATNSVIEGQATKLTKISLPFSNLSQDLHHFQKHLSGPMPHPAVTIPGRHFLILWVALYIIAPGQFPSFSQVIMKTGEKCYWMTTVSTFFRSSNFSLKCSEVSQS